MNLAVAEPPPIETSNSKLDFDTLYRECRDDVYAYVAYVLGTQQLAEDATAATFERAYKRRQSYDAKRGTPRSWIFQLARSTALDELRRTKRRRQRERDAQAAEPLFGTEPDTAARSDLGAALAKLSPGDRELLALRFYADLSYVEIARVLGTSESNAGTQLHRAIKKLRRLLDA